MSTLDVVADVLREVAPRALSARQVVELANGRLPTASRTPETVVSRDLAIDVKRHGNASRFLRVAPGEFLLKEALPTAFYNDIEPYAAAWTRNLIAAEEIAAGVVDERSIRDLKPTDVASYRQCHFFSGIGVWSRALRDAGWPDDASVWSGSCPCGPWSQAGQKRGFDDERHLWPEWFRLIRECRPAVIFGEQVASKDGLAWLDLVLADLEGEDYTVRAIDLCAAGCGAPHLRQRLYFVAVARERGREVVSATWLHDRGQSWDDAARRGTADGRASVALSDAPSTRRTSSQDVGADRGDAGSGAEAREWRATRDLEPQRGGADDGAGAVSDADRVVRDPRWAPSAHGRPEIESDRYGEADGAGCHCVGSAGLGDSGLTRLQGGVSGARGWNGAVSADQAHVAAHGSGELGDAGRDGTREHARELPRDEAQHEEWSALGDHAPVLASTAYRPGDRVRIVGNPTWGGAVGGFWARDVEWIYCRPAPGHENGCFRPAESGTQPLVDGSASGMGRTRAKRLRGYGNAIALPIATVFIESVMDSLKDAGDKARESVTPVEDSADEQPIAAPPAWAWTGPNSGEIAPSGMLFGRVPGERWPYGPPSAHESGCNLFPHRGSPGGLFCDCAASAADDVENGVGA